MGLLNICLVIKKEVGRGLVDVGPADATGRHVWACTTTKGGKG